MGGPPFFHDRQVPPSEVDLRQIEMGHGRPAHPGFHQRIHDGAVAIRAVARAARALPRFIALAIFRAPANREEEIGRIEQAPALGRGERPVHLEPGAEGRELDGGHRMP
jgi:hypothetical protein